MCFEGTAFNLEGGVQGGHVLWKENWKLESVESGINQTYDFQPPYLKSFSQV